MEAPSGVKPLLIHSQIDTYCKNLARFGAQGISTAYLQETVNAVRSHVEELPEQQEA